MNGYDPIQNDDAYTGRTIDECDREVDAINQAALDGLYAIPDNELPGMWERADFMGGATDNDDITDRAIRDIECGRDTEGEKR